MKMIATFTFRDDLDRSLLLIAQQELLKEAAQEPIIVYAHRQSNRRYVNKATGVVLDVKYNNE